MNNEKEILIYMDCPYCTTGQKLHIKHELKMNVEDQITITCTCSFCSQEWTVGINVPTQPKTNINSVLKKLSHTEISMLRNFFKGRN